MQQYNPLKTAIKWLRLLIGIATVIIGTYAIKTLFPEIGGYIATLIVAAALCVIEPTKDYLTSCIYYEVFTINANRYAWTAILCALLISVIAASCYLNVLGVTHYQNTTTRHVAINADTMARHDAAVINAQIAQLNAQKDGIIAANGYNGKLNYTDPQKANVARIDSTVTALRLQVISIETAAKTTAQKQFEQQTEARNFMGLFLELATIVIIFLKLYLCHIEQPETKAVEQTQPQYDAAEIKAAVLAEIVPLLAQMMSHDMTRHDAKGDIMTQDATQQQNDKAQSSAVSVARFEYTLEKVIEAAMLNKNGKSWKSIARDLGGVDNTWKRKAQQLAPNHKEQPNKAYNNGAK
jgi:uncharacterized membrane protein YiaA